MCGTCRECKLPGVELSGVEFIANNFFEVELSITQGGKRG